MPLGASPHAVYVDTTVLLPAPATLLLYTDGLVEDRRYPIELGMTDLCRMVATGPVEDPDALAEWVLSADVWPHPRTDDVALLAITTEQLDDPAPRSAQRRFPGDASSAPSARRFAGDVITAWGLSEVADTAQLLLGEVITNAVQHTVGDVRVRVAHEAGRLRVEVIDGSDRVPDVRPIDTDAENGRGLFIVQALADGWGYEPVETGGKTVWFELRT
jgi:anti-sigma regulatory factor (Ser/Thr protein kinase)